MRTQLELRTPGARQPNVLVLLPPSLSGIDDFARFGFIDALRQSGVAADLLLADLGAQHVLERSVFETLHTKAIAPALTQGYEKIWLCGISMGAFSALHYAAVAATDAGAQAPLAGLLLLAPYPGTGDVLGEIRTAGGAAAWHRQQAENRADERLWWHWLCERANGPARAPEVQLYTSDQDRFFRGQQLMCELLPDSQVHIGPGKHDWPTWLSLWQEWLGRGLQFSGTP